MAIDAYLILPKKRPGPDSFRAAWAFQTEQFAAAHLRKLDEVQIKRRRRPLPSDTHSIHQVRLEYLPEAIEALPDLNFLPAVGIMKSNSFLFQGSADWYNIRLFHDERAAKATFTANYSLGRHRINQVAIIL